MTKKKTAKLPASDQHSEHSALEMHMQAVQEIERLDQEIVELREQGKNAQAKRLDKRRQQIADVLAQVETARRPRAPGESAEKT